MTPVEMLRQNLWRTAHGERRGTRRTLHCATHGDHRSTHGATIAVLGLPLRRTERREQRWAYHSNRREVASPGLLGAQRDFARTVD
jgi:hypothetical protein